MIVVETKLVHKNKDCEELQDRLRAALMRTSLFSLAVVDSTNITGIEEVNSQETDREEDYIKMKKMVEAERVKKQEAINKLAQIMYQRQNTGKGINDKQPPRNKAQEREIRRLRGELEKETRRSQQLVEKFQQQLEDIKQVLSYTCSTCVWYYTALLVSSKS